MAIALDGHAGQGNGEVDITAMETALNGSFRFVVRKDLHLKWPRAETPTHYIAMGMDEELVIAAKQAVREMIDFLVTEKGLRRDDAYMLSSVAADFSITQLAKRLTPEWCLLMRPIGFSTGALALSDFRRALTMLRESRMEIVELPALRMEEPEPLISAIPDLDLSSFRFISIHAPSRFEPQLETRVLDILSRREVSTRPVVVHPDVIFTPALRRQLGNRGPHQ